MNKNLMEMKNKNNIQVVRFLRKVFSAQYLRHQHSGKKCQGSGLPNYKEIYWHIKVAISI